MPTTAPGVPNATKPSCSRIAIETVIRCTIESPASLPYYFEQYPPDHFAAVPRLLPTLLHNEQATAALLNHFSKKSRHEQVTSAVLHVGCRYPRTFPLLLDCFDLNVRSERNLLGERLLEVDSAGNTVLHKLVQQPHLLLHALATYRNPRQRKICLHQTNRDGDSVFAVGRRSKSSLLLANYAAVDLIEERGLQPLPPLPTPRAAPSTPCASCCPYYATAQQRSRPVSAPLALEPLPMPVVSPPPINLPPIQPAAKKPRERRVTFNLG